ncbi:Peptide exporter [Forsythia ovata]|uniref:Peptide exporter n=1 Tax=Forsythia ovata TaxID=205694 RepID=A0ABD1WX70_9LAMI
MVQVLPFSINISKKNLVVPTRWQRQRRLRRVMKDGRITQDGKYNDILKSGSDFMELVGAHKEALSALDSIEAGAAVVGEDSSTGNAKNFLQKKEFPTDQNDKTDNAIGTNGQLIQAIYHYDLENAREDLAYA